MASFLRSSSFVAFALCVAACSSGTTSGGSGASGSGQITGTVGGKAFAFRSGLAHVDKQGAVDLILSDAAALCDSVTQMKFHAGETIVQAYGLTGTVPGKFVPKNGDTKYASVASTCAAGQSVEGKIDKRGDATASEFTISSLSATAVAGTFTMTFDDGSSLSGSFDLPVCAQSEAEKSTCY